MGHVSLKRLEKLPSLTTGTGAIKGVDATAHSDKCVTCKYTKMTKVISRMPPLKSTRRGERTFSDYWGPYKVANLQGSQYFLSFVDDFSRRSEVYFGSRLTLKENFQRYKAKFEVETGEKLGLIRTDNAKEYHALEKDLLKEGIQMEFTDPYTPEQNGVAERLNRTLMQMVRAMQLWAGLPREFWGEALMVANYLRNRLPTNTHGGKMTPYEAWYGRRPDLGHLRTYGCLVHARIPSERRDKMDVVSFQGVFVGYHSSKQYRIYNPKTKKIGWHSSLDFFEDWPGGPLLNVPTESGTWEIDTIDSDYEPDKYLDNQLITNEGGDEVIGDNGQNKNLSVGADPTSQIENPEEITSPVGADPASSNEGIPTIELNAQSNTGIPATIEGKSPRKRTPTTTAFTRSKRERKPYDKYAFDNNQALQTNDDHDPTSYSEAVNGDWRKWKIAIKEELDALLSNGTFLVVNQPSNRDLITSKWVFKVKRHGMVMKIFGGACIWRSAKQRSTSSSSTEAEYVSMCEAGKQLVWASRLMSQLHLRPNKAIDLKGDNQGCLALIKNPEHHSRTKHIDVQYHYIREIVDDGLIRISYVPTAEMLADIFTKLLPQASFERLRASLGVKIVS